MGGVSNDLDIALDNMMGKEFTEKVNEYLKREGRGVGRGKEERRRGEKARREGEERGESPEERKEFIFFE